MKWGRGLGRGGSPFLSGWRLADSNGPPRRVKNHSVFDVFRRWSGKLGFLTCKKHSVFELFVMLRPKNTSVFGGFTKYSLTLRVVAVDPD